MSPFKLGKSENEKMMERRSRLSRWKSEIDRALRSYERNREKNIENVKVSMQDGNEQKARLFASNIIMLNSAIRGLKDYKLFLDNIDLNLQFAKTTRDVWASLKQGSQDLIKSQLSEKQLTQMSMNIDNIMISSEEIQDRLNSQLDQISTSVDQIGQKEPEKIDDMLNQVRERIGTGGSSGAQAESKGKESASRDKEEEAVSDLIRKITGEDKNSSGS